LLVGNVNTIPEHGKIHVRVVDYVPANYTQAGMSFVSFTHRTRQDLLERKRQIFPDASVRAGPVSGRGPQPMGE